jgi:RNA 2',3'-cyclic 3'-phosphodiesterase
VLRVASSLDDALGILGIARDARPWVPHLTLARLREPTDLREVLATTTFTAAGEASALTLYRSELSPRGPTYTALARGLLCPVLLDRDHGSSSSA